MTIVFYYGSGSPFAWRVWLALEHKKLPYELRVMSFDKDDLKQPAFQALTPRGKVPLIQDDEYVTDSLDELLEQVLFVPQDKRNDAAITAAKDKFLAELPHWRAAAAAGKDFLVGAVGAADFTVYPFFALALRMQKRHPSLGLDAAFGPQLTAWMRRVEALPYFEKTVPPHWRT